MGEIIAIWTLADIGYYLVPPILGYAISYNASPGIIAAYFGFWAILCIWHFSSIYGSKLVPSLRIRYRILLGTSAIAVAVFLVWTYSFLPNLAGPILAPYTDILLATPWYFLPKALEILVQQLLVAALIIQMYEQFGTLKKVFAGYVICFVGAHLLQFAASGTPLPYAATMTAGAFISAFIFPYLILKVRGGFAYTYLIHFLFYLLIALILHAFPPPGYIA